MALFLLMSKVACHIDIYVSHVMLLAFLYTITLQLRKETVELSTGKFIILVHGGLDYEGVF